MKRRIFLKSLTSSLLFSQTSFAQDFSDERVQEEFIFDATQQICLHQKNSRVSFIPASLTKLMTIKILLEAFDKNLVSPNTEFLISENAKNKKPSKLNLKNLKTLSAYDCLNALIIHSANDCACVIAENLSGSEQNFTKIMNKKCEEFELFQTQFYDASGLSPLNRSNAYDITRLNTLLYYRHPQYNHLFSQKSWEWNGQSFQNHNHLLEKDGIDFGKTGYLKTSGFHITLSSKLSHRRIFLTLTGFKTQKERDLRALTLLENIS